MLGVGLSLATRRQLRYGFGIAAVTLTLCMQVMAVPGVSTLVPVERAASLQALGRVAAVLTSDETRSQMLAGATASLRSQYGLSPEFIDDVQGLPVNVDVGCLGWLGRRDRLAARVRLPGLPGVHAQARRDERRRPGRRSPNHHADDPSTRDRWAQPGMGAPAYQLHLYCDYEAAGELDGWRLLGPARASRCGDSKTIGSYEAAAGEAVSVPYQPESTHPRDDTPTAIARRSFVGTLLRPPTMTVDYGGRWRWAYGAEAKRIMLNAPAKDVAVSGLPVTPWPSLSVSEPATITFETMPMDVRHEASSAHAVDVRGTW